MTTLHAGPWAKSFNLLMDLGFFKFRMIGWIKRTTDTP